jgi:hypothetical protein
MSNAGNVDPRIVTQHDCSVSSLAEVGLDQIDADLERAQKRARCVLALVAGGAAVTDPQRHGQLSTCGGHTGTAAAH